MYKVCVKERELDSWEEGRKFSSKRKLWRRIFSGILKYFSSFFRPMNFIPNKRFNWHTSRFAQLFSTSRIRNKLEQNSLNILRWMRQCNNPTANKQRQVKAKYFAARSQPDNKSPKFTRDISGTETKRKQTQIPTSYYPSKSYDDTYI